jgi:2'-5' RNA ligase
MDQADKHSMYYVAIVCSGEAGNKVLKHKQWMKEHFGCTVALKSPAHITLIPPFWMEEAAEEQLKQVFQSFTSDVDEIIIQLSGFDHFSNRVLFVKTDNSAALQTIKKQTELHFSQSFGNIIKIDERPFHPHVTIANRDLRPGDFIKAWEYFSKLEFNENFLANTISLLKLSPGKWNIIAEKNWR